MLVFEAKSGKLISAILRTGRRPTGKEIRAILKRIVARIRKAWPTVVIVVRGDSHYATPEVFAYCDRGQMENFIKELKLDLKSDRTSCHRFTANAFRLFLHSAAYTLLHTYRDALLGGTAFATARFDTIRLHFLKIGAAVREGKTTLRFRLPQSYPHQDLFARMQARLPLLN